MTSVPITVGTYQFRKTNIQSKFGSFIFFFGFSPFLVFLAVFVVFEFLVLGQGGIVSQPNRRIR